MTHLLYTRKHATALLPLLRSISREIQERTEVLERIEDRIEAGEPDPETELEWIADAAAQRRAIRRARQELEQLGCSIVGTEPITIRIPGQRGARKRSFVYHTGDAVLR